MRYEFFIPEEPVGQARPKARAFGGHAQVYKPAASRRAEDIIRQWIHRRVGDNPVPLQGALRLDVIASLSRPASVSAKRRPHPIVKPDIDNLAKTVLDAATRSRIWKDDAQVVDLHVGKQYSDPPGWAVIIEEIE